MSDDKKSKTKKPNQNTETESKKNTYDVKIKKTITLTAFIRRECIHRDMAIEQASIQLEKEITEKLNSDKNNTTYNFLIEDYMENEILPVTEQE